jgi:hypothetical protein
VAMLSNPGIRIAVSSGTSHSPRAIRAIYGVEDNIIYFMHVQERDRP